MLIPLRLMPLRTFEWNFYVVKFDLSEAILDYIKVADRIVFEQLYTLEKYKMSVIIWLYKYIFVWHSRYIYINFSAILFIEILYL